MALNGTSRVRRRGHKGGVVSIRNKASFYLALKHKLPDQESGFGKVPAWTGTSIKLHDDAVQVWYLGWNHPGGNQAGLSPVSRKQTLGYFWTLDSWTLPRSNTRYETCSWSAVLLNSMFVRACVLHARAHCDNVYDLKSCMFTHVYSSCHSRNVNLLVLKCQILTLTSGCVIS